MDSAENQVLPDLLVSLEPQEVLDQEAKLDRRDLRDSAEHPARGDKMDPLERQELQETAVNRDRKDHKVHLGLLDNLDPPDREESLDSAVNPDNLEATVRKIMVSFVHRANLFRRADGFRLKCLELQCLNQFAQDNLDPVDLPAHLVRRAHKDRLDHEERRELQAGTVSPDPAESAERQAPQEHQDRGNFVGKIKS